MQVKEAARVVRSGEFVKYDLTSAAHMARPELTYQAMWQAGDVVPARIPILGRVWFTTRYLASVEMLKDADLFARQPERAGLKATAHFTWWMPRSLRVFADNMLIVDEPKHRRLRGTVDQAFARRDIMALEGEIEAIAGRLLDALSQREPVDIMSLYSRELPLIVICELLGLKGEERATVKRWSARLTTATGVFSLLRAMPGMARMRRFLEAKFERVRQNPEPGLISLLAHPEDGAAPLSDSELLAMVFILFLAGHETTTHLINGAILMLLDHPEQKQALLDDWSHLPLLIEEVLRGFSPIQMTKPRFVTRDVAFHGAALRRGDKVMAHIGAANHDPRKYHQPERFDLTRRPNPHLSFSTGIHFCLGLQLARLEAQIAIRSLFGRHPNLALAVQRDRIDWRGRLGMRAVNTLPLRL